MDSKLGILAGGGELPGRLIQICRERGRPFHVIAIEGQADPDVIGDSPQTWLRLGAAQKALEVARKEKLDEIVMVGPVRRPSIVALRPDALAARVLAKAGASSVMGDDGLLKAIIRQIEDFGFKVFLVFERVVLLSIWHSPGFKPAIENIFNSSEGRKFRTSTRRNFEVIDEVSMNVT